MNPRRGIKPETMAKFYKALRLFEDKENGIDIKTACARAGLSRFSFTKIRSQLEQAKASTDRGQTEACDEVHG